MIDMRFEQTGMPPIVADLAWRLGTKWSVERLGDLVIFRLSPGTAIYIDSDGSLSTCMTRGDESEMAHAFAALYAWMLGLLTEQEKRGALITPAPDPDATA